MPSQGRAERALGAAVVLMTRVESLFRENRKAGRREGPQGSENAFLFLGDQNQKYFPWKRAEDSCRRLVAGVLARSARTPNLSLPAFPPSCCYLLERTRWPESATEASAIQAAVWQPKMCRIVRSCSWAAKPASFGEKRGRAAVVPLRERLRWPTPGDARRRLVIGLISTC